MSKKTALLITIIALFVIALTPMATGAQTPEIVCQDEYTVQAEDWLSKIAAKYYGDYTLFPGIAAATNARVDAGEDHFAHIVDHDLIEPGWKLCIPSQAQAKELTAAYPYNDADSSADSAAAASARSHSVAELTANPWQWVSFTDPMQQFEVDNPQNYALTFNADNTVNVKADCNNAAGSYTASDSGVLNIQPGPMTMALCSPASRSDEFVQKLGFVAGFFIEDGYLYLDMMADGGTFKMANASMKGESAATPAFFPMTAGTTWTYQDNHYDTAEGETITGTYTLEKTVIDVQQGNGYTAAQIQEVSDFRNGSVDVDWLEANPGYLNGYGSQKNYWLIDNGAGVYQQFGNLNLDALESEGFLLYKLPLTDGDSWYSNPDQRAEFTDVTAGPNTGKSSVSTAGAQNTPAGSFDQCYQIETFYNSGNNYEIVCLGVGAVKLWMDHQGTPQGYKTTLTAFSAGE